MQKKQVSTVFFALFSLGALVLFSGCLQKEAASEIKLNDLITKDQAAFDKAINDGIERYVAKQQADQTKAQEEQAKKQAEGMKSVPPKAEGEKVLGAEDAPYTMFVYTDYHCPYCQKFHPTMHAVLEANTDTNAVFRHLPFHETAVPLHEITECVGDVAGKEKFWAFADAVFADAQNITAENYAETLKKIGGIDAAKVAACVKEGKFKTSIQNTMQSAVQMGIQGTPGSVLRNNKTGEVRFVAGAFPQEQVQKMLDELKAAPATTPEVSAEATPEATPTPTPPAQ